MNVSPAAPVTERSSAMEVWGFGGESAKVSQQKQFYSNQTFEKECSKKQVSSAFQFCLH